MDKTPVEDILAEIDKIMLESDRIIHIGTDAQKSDHRVDFVTCIGLVELRKGGRVFYARTSKPKKECGSLHQKLLFETQLTIELGLELMEALPDDTEFVVHADVNPNPKWRSHKHINEVVGWIMGSGFDNVLTKPHAWLASHACDHVVKNKNK